MIILAVDLGEARSGVAACDAGEMLASPVAVIEMHDRSILCDRIRDIAIERHAELIVIGLPRNMDGSEGASAQHARDFAAMIMAASGIPTVMQDERGTTLTAHRYLNETNTRGKKRKNTVDAVAATIILEDYLLYRRNYSFGKN